ncbi:hypothetical protein NDU88_001501 [Pleurodeles waltl]|uniref:Uncharacterized protein n=1 Tax=Pleurodeles waltl TaxID=8319 RepID=A0AAV7U709_PLEWA|nr:hypothetical protein NDU88_001501 [Pleurodeles waltl]
MAPVRRSEAQVTHGVYANQSVSGQTGSRALTGPNFLKVKPEKRTPGCPQNKGKHPQSSLVDKQWPEEDSGNRRQLQLEDEHF